MTVASLMGNGTLARALLERLAAEIRQRSIASEPSGHMHIHTEASLRSLAVEGTYRSITSEPGDSRQALLNG